MAFSSLDRFLLLILGLGLCGTLAELLVEGHTESAPQWIPLGLIAGALAGVAWNEAAPSLAGARVLRWILILFLFSGVVGVALHYRGKAEFQLESEPSLSGWRLFRQAMKSKTPPALAPGVMIQLGLVGLAYQAATKARRSQKGDRI